MTRNISEHVQKENLAEDTFVAAIFSSEFETLITKEKKKETLLLFFNLYIVFIFYY